MCGRLYQTGARYMTQLDFLCGALLIPRLSQAMLPPTQIQSLEQVRKSRILDFLSPARMAATIWHGLNYMRQPFLHLHTLQRCCDRFVQALMQLAPS
jgi:hypothetical protein